MTLIRHDYLVFVLDNYAMKLLMMGVFNRMMVKVVPSTLMMVKVVPFVRWLAIRPINGVSD